MSLDLGKINYRIEITVLSQVNIVFFQNVESILVSVYFSFSFLHLGIVLLHKLYLMLIGKLKLQMLNYFINSDSEGLDMGEQCLVV